VGEIASKSKKKNVYIVSVCDNKERPSICAKKVIGAISLFIKRYIDNEFDQNRSVKITIESFDIDDEPSGYIEFDVYPNRIETDNYRLSRLLEEAVKRATHVIKSTHIMFI
jgi:mevalonate kinase